MNRGVIYAAMAMVAIALIIYAFYPGSTVPSNIPSRFSFNNHTYAFTYVAANLSEQESGLMNKTVTNSTFELFVFPQSGIYPFWMKDTNYALDIIWVNGTKVTYIANATPCSSYSPDQSNCTVYNTYNQGYYANYVIETKAGFVNQTGLKVGDTISFG